uniref:Uncharacterized protein n=1 Tax=Polytomella parva TaxID=51329 RepID=A0A7S0YTI8_9CHLO|mmetsp:Transcript_9070/g.17092  ORF Transcript_9070/g.17092 Transcript_9070/m.17092 type:complete len:246 (+) Transcript_9070:85-822(+)
MVKRKERDFVTNPQGNLRKAREDFQLVDAFSILLSNARLQSELQKNQAPANQTALYIDNANEKMVLASSQQGSSSKPSSGESFNIPYIMECYHCGSRSISPESDFRQCLGCRNIFCTACSVQDYSLSADRAFCLDCFAAGINSFSFSNNDCSHYADFGNLHAQSCFSLEESLKRNSTSSLVCQGPNHQDGSRLQHQSSSLHPYSPMETKTHILQPPLTDRRKITHWFSKVRKDGNTEEGTTEGLR